jgi:hypothetical protein
VGATGMRGFGFVTRLVRIAVTCVAARGVATRIPHAARISARYALSQPAGWFGGRKQRA